MAYQSHLDDPEYWRDRAARVRALADQVRVTKQKRQFYRLRQSTSLLPIRRTNEPRVGGHNSTEAQWRHAFVQ
jgi:hypothetical protein